MVQKLWRSFRRIIILCINPILIVLNIDSPSKYFNRIAKRDLAPAQVDGFMVEHQAPHIREAFDRNVEKVCTFIESSQTLALDLGCGTGRYLQAILEKHPDIELYGVDVSETTLQNYTQQLAPTAQLQVADFTKENPFPTLQFDLIYSLGVLQHIQFFKLQKFFQNVHAAMKPEGHFYFVFAPGESWLDVITNRHFFRYPPDLVSKQLIRAGFVVTESGMLTSENNKNLGYFFVATPKRG